MRKLMISGLIMCSFSALANYSNFAYSIIDDHGNKLSETNNVIKNAIEQNNFLPLSYNSQFSDAASDLFKQVDKMGRFELNAFASPQLINGIEQLVKEFACATYRFQARKGESGQCNGLVRDDTNKEGQPFVYGQFVEKPMLISVNSIRPNMPARSYDIYLPAAKDFPLEYAWGAAHELGSFFVRKRDRKDTVLTVYIDGYKLDINGERSERLTDKPEIVFVVIPKASRIGIQANENAAAKFALADADFIVPLY